MEKRNILFGVCMAMFLFASSAGAEDYQKQTAKSKSDAVSFKRLEGEKVTEKGSFSYTEGLREYTQRRFQETENHIAKVETGQQQLRQQVEQLKDALSRLQKKVEDAEKEKKESSAAVSK